MSARTDYEHQYFMLIAIMCQVAAFFSTMFLGIVLAEYSDAGIPGILLIWVSLGTHVGALCAASRARGEQP